MAPSLYRQIAEESESWAKEGLITPEQRTAILGRYEETSAPAAPANELPLFIRALLILACVLIGAAVLLVVSFNWAALPGAAKLSIVIGGWLASGLAGFGLRRTARKTLAEAVFFLCGIMFGVAVWQIGQVFHLPADFPLGFLIWGTGVFLLAVTLASTPLHLLAVATLGGWVIASLFGMTPGPIFWFAIPRSLVPLTAIGLPFFAVAGILVASMQKKQAAPFFYAALFLFWWIMQGIACKLGFSLAFHVAMSGLICLAISNQLPQKHSGGVTLFRLGVLLVFGGLLGPSFLVFWSDGLLYRDYYVLRHYNDVTPLWKFPLAAVNFVVLLGITLIRWRRHSLMSQIRQNSMTLGLAAVLLVLWVVPLLYVITIAPPRGHVDELSWLIARAGMILINIIILAFTIVLIQTGLKRENSKLFWGGVLYFLLWAIIRYIDLFSGIGGMLGAALMFFFCAVVLLGIVYFWLKRKPNPSPMIEGDTNLEPLSPLVERGRLILERGAVLWQRERFITASIAGVMLVLLAVLGSMIARELVPHVSGTTISVTTVPVDPRDMFRGDYVILRYPFSNLNTIPTSGNINRQRTGQTVYVTMVKDGELWAASGIGTRRPSEGIFLRGTLKDGGQIVYGIESYFVQEGTGKEIENAMRGIFAPLREGEESPRVVVDLVVSPSGQVAIKTVHVVKNDL